MKRFIITASVMLLCAMTLCQTVLCAFDSVYPDNLYKDGMFNDVSENDWYYSYVKTAVNYGLTSGKGNGMFDPGGTVSAHQAVKFATTLHSLYFDGSAGFSVTEPYYTAYYDYAQNAGISSLPGDGKQEPLTRGEFALMLCQTLPSDVFTQINELPDGVLYGVNGDSDEARAVYTLFRAGIMTGSDRYGTVRPGDYITRAEVCAIMTRIMEPVRRAYFTIPEALPATVIYKRSSSAVFHIETFDENGNSIRKGSGFFISEDGLAATNNHVLDGAYTAEVSLEDGRNLKIDGVTSHSAEYNLAVMQVDTEGSAVSFLKISDSGVRPGQTVYAIGNPQGLVNTISEGVIQHPERVVDKVLFFQFNASISFGSGGSPVLDTSGHVVGVASSSFSAGDRMNLAVPIYLLDEMQSGGIIPLSVMRKT